MAYELDDATRKRLGLPPNYSDPAPGVPAAPLAPDTPDATTDPVARVPVVGGDTKATTGDVSAKPAASQPVAPGGGDAPPVESNPWSTQGTGTVPPPPLAAPTGYVPGAAMDVAGYGSVTFDPQGHPSINGSMVDSSGQPIVAPSMSQEAWIAQNTANSPYNAPATVIQSQAPIAGGTADNSYTYENVLGGVGNVQNILASNPNATLGDTGATKQQLIDAGLGHLVGYGDEWKNLKVGEFSPQNISLAPDGEGAVQDGWYEGGVSTGAYHPVDKDPANGSYLDNGQVANGQPADANLQASNAATLSNPGTGTGPAGQRPVPVVGGGDATIGVPSLPPRVGSGFDPSTIPAVNNAPAVASSGVPVVGGPLSSINPDDDLRSKQINPVNSDKTGALSDLAMGAANKVGGGKSRGEISQGYLDAFDEAAQPKIRDQIRNVWQDAASRGRIGMGDVSVDSLRPVTDYATQRSAYAKQLAADSAEGDINDRLNNLSALDNAEGQSYGQDASGRNELRSERSYQTDAQRNAEADAVQQWLMEQQAEQQDFNRGNTLAGVGYANSPSNLLFGAGQSYGNAAGGDFGALAQLLGPYLANLGR